ncbi:Uu.00g109580.m01.CDS01 [Anthostomella pinea]|uniref:Terpene synthase n=1 Tax=Anthostomella pinea TaxID=933095 RepID=A0AAI8VFP7_9PEZI|nr:Uu.00g109580.m01.CDS01 [Anthostomella pinea]
MKAAVLHLVRQLRRALSCSVFSRRSSCSSYHKEEEQSSETSSERARAHQGLSGDALTVATQLSGKVLQLPDLTKIFETWPSATNKHTKELEVLVDELLERVIINERKLHALKQAGFARLMSLWYPDADWPELVVATAYSVWIFVWDDEIDSGETEAATNEVLAQAYYQESLTYIRRVLGLDGEDQVEVEAPLQNMTLFGDVGRGVRGSTDTLQRQRFFRELENFMLQVGVEHSHRTAGSIPTVEEYLHIRSGSVGCGPQIAITDYMLKVRLPESVMESEAMRALWKETIHICLILNDVYSVQKEIAQGSLLNIVPVMFKNMKSEEQDLGAVSRELDSALRATMARFEAAADTLTGMASGDVQLKRNIEDYIRWCRYFTTGVLYWSLESRRYGMADCINTDGTLSIVL